MKSIKTYAAGIATGAAIAAASALTVAGPALGGDDGPARDRPARRPVGSASRGAGVAHPPWTVRRPSGGTGP